MQPETPLISVIIPVFNAQHVINKALLSISCQSFKNYELLIIDGASKDNTLSILKEFQKTNECTVVSEKDKGIYDAMNKGIALAKGEWLFFLGADDQLHDENVFKDLISFSEKNNADLIYGNVFFENDGSVYDGPFNKWKILCKNISHQAIFYKKSLFEKMGLYDLAYPILADYVFNLTWFANKNIKALYFNRVISIFGQAGISSNDNKRDILFKKNKAKIVYKHFPFPYFLYSLLIVPWIDFFRKKFRPSKVKD